MKDQTTIKKYLTFYLNECDTIKEYLEEMACKGWKLKNVDKASFQINILPKNRYVFFFEKIVPQKLIYTIEIIDKLRPKQSIQEFIDYCKEAGWDYVCDYEMLHIFVTADEKSVPISTDAEIKFTTIKRSMIKDQIYGWIFFPLFNLLWIYFNSLNFEFYITLNIMLMITLIFVISIIIILKKIINTIIWIEKTQKKLFRREPIIYKNPLVFKRKSIYRWSFITTMLMIVILLALSFQSAMITPPLDLQDFGSIQDQNISVDKYTMSSVLAKNTSCSYRKPLTETSTISILSYNIFKSNSDMIIQKYLNYRIYRHSLPYQQIDKPAWGAVSVYASNDARYRYTYVVYKNAVFSYDADQPLTNEQIVAIVNKLNLNQR